jgi:hypothetical protein
MALKPKDRSAKARGLKLVSFEIDAGIWQDFKIHSIKIDRTSSSLLRELIEAELKPKKKADKRRRSSPAAKF